MQPSRLDTGLAGEGTFRWVAADLTLALEEARRRLDLSPLASVALGRALTGAVLLQRLSFKVPARLILEMVGDGPLGSVRAEAQSNGRIRGTVANPRVVAEGDAFQISDSLGKGLLRVTRDMSGTETAPGKRYASQVNLVSGELGDDLTHYLEQSEQIRSAVLLGVLPLATGIGSAGGLIVEALPGTEEDLLSRLEGNLQALDGVSRCLREGGIGRLLNAAFDGFEIERLETYGVEYHCSCNRERLLGYLQALGADEFEELAGDDGRCEAVCSFCGNRYLYGPDELDFHVVEAF